MSKHLIYALIALSIAFVLAVIEILYDYKKQKSNQKKMQADLDKSWRRNKEVKTI